MTIISSIHFSPSVMSDFATPWTAAHQASHPKPTPGICLNSCPLSQWCHPNISSSVVPFFSCPQSFPASVQFSSFTQLCPTLCNPMNRSMPGLPVHHQLPELAQTHIHRVGDAIQPSHPLSSPSPPAFNLSQHQGLLHWVSSLHQVAKVLEFQLQHQSFHWVFRTDFL